MFWRAVVLGGRTRIRAKDFAPAAEYCQPGRRDGFRKSRDNRNMAKGHPRRRNDRRRKCRCCAPFATACHAGEIRPVSLLRSSLGLTTATRCAAMAAAAQRANGLFCRLARTAACLAHGHRNDDSVGSDNADHARRANWERAEPNANGQQPLYDTYGKLHDTLVSNSEDAALLLRDCKKVTSIIGSRTFAVPESSKLRWAFSQELQGGEPQNRALAYNGLR